MKKMMMMVAVCMLSIVSVAQTTESLSIADFEITAGETKSVDVEVTTDMEYTAFLFDILLPEGLTIALNDRDRLDVKLSDEMSDEHILTAQKVSETENRYRFACFSASNYNFRQTSGTILTLAILADEDVPGGELVGIIEKIAFTTARPAVDYPFADTTFTITCKENPSTGINGLTGGKNVKQFYTLDGKQVKTAQKGVNIIRQGNGTVQKVLVK